MTTRDNTVVAATTAAATFAFYVKQGATLTVSATNLGVGEAVDVQKLAGTPDTGAYIDVYQLDGTQLQITSTANPVAIDSPGWYRLSKGTTASAVSLHLDA